LDYEFVIVNSAKAYPEEVRFWPPNGSQTKITNAKGRRWAGIFSIAFAIAEAIIHLYEPTTGRLDIRS
jgi:hypothetical protein